MAKVKYKKVGSGIFFSPVLEADSPYELLDVVEGRTVVGKKVRCVQSKELFDLDVLNKPTNTQLIDQISAAFREIGAWLVANAPNNPPRQRAALRAIRRTIKENYLADDLDRDVAWIATADLGQRIAFLRDNMTDGGRDQMVKFAAEIASSGSQVSETDAEFIERVGTGLGMPREAVYDIVVSAIQKPPTINAA